MGVIESSGGGFLCGGVLFSFFGEGVFEGLNFRRIFWDVRYWGIYFGVFGGIYVVFLVDWSNGIFGGIFLEI